VRPRAAAVLAAAALAGCGATTSERPDPSPAPREPAATATPTPTPTPTPRPHRRVPRLHCPAAGVLRCAAVRGPVVYVERVDPDGDGDLHVVVIGGDVTAPGFTAIDVRVGLRPRHDPRVGDVVSAYGPVQPGHLRQSQIHALAFRAQRR
jgi:hypothetical protein